MTMPETTTNDDGMRRSLAVSAGVHLALLIALIIGLPHLMPPMQEQHAPMPFEIVEIAEITTTKEAPPPPDVKPEPPKPEPPKPETKQELAPVPPPPPPEVVKPPQQAEAIKPIPQPKPKPPPPDAAKPQTDDFNKLLKNLEATKKTESAPAQQTEAKPVAQSKAPAAPVSAMELRTLQDAIRSQVEHCWNMPIGARGAETLVVEVGMDVADDGTVMTTDIVDKGRYNSDSYFRAAADAAVRAVHDPRCSPLKLPSERYDVWKHINFTFDPRDLI